MNLTLIPFWKKKTPQLIPKTVNLTTYTRGIKAFSEALFDDKEGIENEYIRVLTNKITHLQEELEELNSAYHKLVEENSRLKNNNNDGRK